MAENTTPHGEQPRTNSSSSSATTKIQAAKKSPFDQAKSIGFPIKIGNMRHMRISCFKYDRADRRRRVAVSGSSASIFLPIPAELQVAGDGIYNMDGMLSSTSLKNVDSVGDAGQLLLNAGTKKGQDWAKAGMDVIGVGAQVSADLGKSVNPKTELTYQANGLRQFTFNYNLAPKDEAEAKMIRKLKQFFLRRVYSGTKQGGTEDAAILDYPPMFTIGFFDEEGREIRSLFFIMPCHLTNVQIQENPHGASTFIKGADAIYPVATQMTLSFQEGRMLDQNDFIEWEEHLSNTGSGSET